MLKLSFKYFRGLYFGLIILLFLIAIGTAGYMVIEEYSFIEGFYMTIITVSTVGFAEVHPLSEAGRLFTSFLILSGFGTFAYAATSVGGSILSGQYNYFFKNYKLMQAISSLENHVIICGFGNNGEAAAHNLSLHDQKFVIIERDPSKLQRLYEHKSYLYIEGDATDDNNFIEAKIEKAKSVITTLPSDADNVFVCLTAKQLNSKLTIISRATDLKSEAKLKLAGASNVIMPDRVGGNHMATLVSTPDVNEFLDLLSITNSHSVNLAEVKVNKLQNPLSVKDLVESVDMAVRVIGIKGINNEYLVSPAMNQQIHEKEKLFVLGTRENIEKLNARFR